MKIISIQNHKQNHSFKAKPSSRITKKFLEARKISTKTEKQSTKNTENLILSGSNPTLGKDILLKLKGITYCIPKGNTINIGGYKNGDFYQIKTVSELSPEQAKEFILYSLIRAQDNLGGLINYQDMINDIGRQDIIRKGLKLHTYELDNSISENNRKLAAKLLIKKTNIAITPNNLFYLDSDAFFYDKVKKTVYGTTINSENKSDTAKPKFITCTFQTDKNGKAIGYKVNDWSFYYRNYVDSEYLEQQEPSSKLAPVMVIGDNIKDIAEAFRFGNSTIDEKFQIKIPLVLEDLHKKTGINSAIQENLQFIKHYNKNGEIERKIGYYNPATGRSFVYNKDGKYLYQLEYLKDNSGNITSCTKF